MKKIKKQNKQEKIMLIKRKTMLLLHIFKFSGFLMILAGFCLPIRSGLIVALLLIFGFLFFLCSSFARDYYFRCPSCGEILLKKQSLKKKIKGECPKGCPKCSWAVKIEYK